MKSYNRNRQNFNNKFDNNKPRRDDRGPKAQGLQVFVRDGEDISKALRKLKKKVEAAGILKDLRDKQFYEKPSEKRRKAKKAGIARWKKKQKELDFKR